MFEEDKSRTHIDVKREQIITLLNSTIRPHVAVADSGSEPTDAFACTFKQGNLYETLAFFHLTNSHRGVVYRWDDGPQPRDQAKMVEREALKFLEAMGFQMDSLHFRKKPVEEQQALLDTLPCFKPDLSYLREPEEEAMEVEEVTPEEAEEGEDLGAVDEIMVESLGETGEVAEEAAPEEEMVAEPEAGAAPEEIAWEQETDDLGEGAGVSEIFEEEAFPAEESAPGAEASSPLEEVAVEVEDDWETETAEEAVAVAEPEEAIPAAPEPASTPKRPPAPPPTSPLTPPPSPAQPVSTTKAPEDKALEPLARFLASM